MNKNRLGESFPHEVELIAGTTKGVLLAKLENIVLLDITYTPASMIGGVYKQIFTFAPVHGDSPRKGVIRLDNFDASTGELTEGNEIHIEINPFASDGVDNADPSKKYKNITQEKMERILNALRSKGFYVRGTNPWDVDVRQHGIKLRGTWEKEPETLLIKVTDCNWYVPYAQIWKVIDPLIEKI